MPHSRARSVYARLFAKSEMPTWAIRLGSRPASSTSRRTGEPLLTPSRRSWWASSVTSPACCRSTPRAPRPTANVIELSPPTATSSRDVRTARSAAAVVAASSPSGSGRSPRSTGARPARSASRCAAYVEYRANAHRTAAGVASAPVGDSEVQWAGTPRTARSTGRTPGPAASQPAARGQRGSSVTRRSCLSTRATGWLWSGSASSAIVALRRSGATRRACGRSAVGSASPCQGEGRGFESRRPLGGGPVEASFRWSGREARQRPAKPCTRVQIPSPPRTINSTGDWRSG